MKNILLSGLIALSLTFTMTGCGSGQKNMSAYIPNQVVNEFYDMYPSAKDVTWKNKDGLYEADFELGHKGMKATFTPDGDWVKVDS
jgi:hypothetical protein